MRSVFQEEAGEVEALEGTEIVEAKAERFEDDPEGTVSILWLRPKDENYWFRIFIDFLYCNVQVVDGELAYLEYGSDSKLFGSKDTEIIDFTNWLGARVISSASARLVNESNIHMELTVKFSNHEFVSLSLHNDDYTYVRRGYCA